MAKVSSEYEEITPSKAELMLSKQPSNGIQNRKLLDSHVEWLAHQISTGKFLFNGEPIIIDENGELLDGQHRLRAVIKAGKPIESIVVRGISPNAFQTIDIGRKRTVGDMLSMTGFTNTAVLAASIGWLWLYEKRMLLRTHTSQGYSAQHAFATIKKHPHLKESVAWAAKMRKFPVGKLFPPGPMGFLHYVFLSHDEANGRKFFDEVMDLEPCSKGSASKTLRQTMISQWRKGPAAREIMAITVKAWSAYLRSESITYLKWGRYGKNTESFPVFPGDSDSRGKAIVHKSMKDKLLAKQISEKATRE